MPFCWILHTKQSYKYLWKFSLTRLKLNNTTYDWPCIPNRLTRQFPVKDRRHQYLHRTVSRWCYQQYLISPQSLPLTASFCIYEKWCKWGSNSQQYTWMDKEEVVGAPPVNHSQMLLRLWTSWEKKLQWTYCSAGCTVRPLKGNSFKGPKQKSSEEKIWFVWDKATEAAEHQWFMKKGQYRTWRGLKRTRHVRRVILARSCSS